MLERSNELIHVKHLARYLTHSKSSTNASYSYYYSPRLFMGIELNFSLLSSRCTVSHTTFWSPLFPEVQKKELPSSNHLGKHCIGLENSKCTGTKILNIFKDLQLESFCLTLWINLKSIRPLDPLVLHSLLHLCGFIFVLSISRS